MIEQTPIERALDAVARLDPPPARQKTIPCPTTEHEDNQPAARLYPDGGFYCFACNAKGDALDLYALRNRLTLSQAIRQLGGFDKEWKRPAPKPEPREMLMPETVKELLIASAEHAVTWETAKLLAMQEPVQAKLDILAGWDGLNERGIDIPEAWELSNVIRGVALFRHANPAKAHEPRERNLAVRKLLQELQDA